jgi:hypothetical protein
MKRSRPESTNFARSALITLWLVASAGPIGCGASLPTAARATASRLLECSESDVRGELESSSLGSSKWLVGCDMRTVELICSQNQCRAVSWRDKQGNSQPK